MSNADVEFIKYFIESNSKANWESSKTPYLLTKIGTGLRDSGIPYKEIIGARNLKSFVQEEMADTQKIVLHPYITEKIGVIPVSEHYEYEVAQTKLFSDKVAPERPRHKTRGEINPAIQLLEIFSKLNDQELAQVNIPVSVLVKLMGR